MNTFIIVIGGLILLASVIIPFIYAGINKYSDPIPTFKKKTPIIGIILGLTIIILGKAFTIVPTGSTGVISRFGLIKDKPLTHGFNWVAPFIEDVTLVNNKQQERTYVDKVWSESSEQTVVFMENITITYTISSERSPWICANVTNWEENLISDDLISSSLKTASRSIETVNVTNRAIAEPKAMECLQESLDEKYGENTVKIVAVVINNIDFEDSYNEALAKRQEAIVNQEYQAIINKTNIEQAEAEAEAKRAAAKGEADAKLIAAQASADAEKIQADAKASANKTISESITDNTLHQDAIDKWNGQLPKYIDKSGAGTFGIMDSTE